MLQIIFLPRRKDTENVAYRIAKQSLKLHLSWKQPSFLRVPKNYEQILEVNITYDIAFFYLDVYLSYLNLSLNLLYQFYHKRKCKGCDRVPKDPTVCLMCGTMVCLKETCCRQTNSNNGRY